MMKKEYFILAVLIALLSAYLFMNRENTGNYALPDLESLEVSEITGINIETDQTRISLIKEDNNWYAGDEKYRVDTKKVDGIIEVVKDLELTALVSEKKDYARYELDDENKISVKVNAGTEQVRAFDIGKAAPTYRHTFVRLNNAKEVYHAKKSFRSDFDVSLDDLRNKAVFSFDADEIKSVSFERKGIKRKFFIDEDQEKETDTQDKGKAQSKEPRSSDVADPSRAWTAEDGKAFEAADLKEMVSILKDMRCDRYAYLTSRAAYAAAIPMCRIIVDDDTFSVYEKNEKDHYLAGSSQADDLFFLDGFNGNQLITKTDSLLGIPPEEKTD